MEELKPMFTNRKSFYKKAKIIRCGGRITLLSYGREVAYFLKMNLTNKALKDYIDYRKTIEGLKYEC